MKYLTAIILVLSATWLASDYSANYTNQFRADNQFFINDIRHLEQERRIQGLIDSQQQREFEQEFLKPINEHEMDY